MDKEKNIKPIKIEKMNRLLNIIFAVAMLFPIGSAYNSCTAASPPRKEKKDTLAILTDKANKGDAVAQNELGTWYYLGKNVKQDYKTALEWFSKSAKQDNAYGIANMAMCYQFGNGIKKDTVMALKLYKSAIKRGDEKVIPKQEAKIKKSGDLFAARLLMDCYKEGIGVKRDFKKAESYQLIIAKSGDAEQQFQYALACLNSKRSGEAAKWFKEASKSGRKEAIYYYGYLLFNGMGIEQDKVEGLKLMAKAASQGMIAADYQIGKAYYEGNGIKKDISSAKQLLSKAAAANKDAAWYLGLCYLEGDTIDYYHASQWLAEAAKKHEKDLNSVLSDPKYKNFQDYILGLKKYYIDNDYEAALKLFQTVAKKGNAEGLTMQAVCLANKNYAKRNTKKAIKIYEKALAKGSHAAEYYLSSMYEVGEGMKQPDKEKALTLLQSSAIGGIAYAQCKLGDKYFNGSGVSKDLTQAATLYLQAESQNRLTPASAKNLISCYERGISALPDINDASKRIEALKKTSNNTTLIDFLRAIKK